MNDVERITLITPDFASAIDHEADYRVRSNGGNTETRYESRSLGMVALIEDARGRETQDTASD